MNTPASFWPIAVYVTIAILIWPVVLGVSALLGQQSHGRARNEPFESGVVSASPERLRLSAKFYLVAVFFVIFDVEALFLYAWSISVKESGWAGYVEAVIFIAILALSLVYLARIGALSWAPEGRKKIQMREAAHADQREHA